MSETLETHLVRVNEIDYVELYDKDGEVENLLQQIEEAALSEITTSDTEEGRAIIKSLAYKVARIKTIIDDEGKNIVSEWKKRSAVIDAKRKQVRDRLDALKDKVRKPLTEWEDAEAKRIEQERMEEEARKAEEDRIERERVAKIEAELAEMKRKEQERAEDERLKRLEKEQKEREERIAKEAEERAKMEAAEQARREIEDAKRREQEAIEAAERAEREKQEAAKRAEREKQQAIEAERRRIHAENERLERERAERERLEKEEADRKAANTRHRAKVKSDAIECFMRNEISQQEAERIFGLIDKGMINHIYIKY